MALLQRHLAPPPHYYAERILDLLAGVEKQYSDVLDGAERSWIDAFRAINPRGQRLLARLVGRKGPLFRVDSLRYPEVDHPDRALTELAERGLVRMDPAGPADAQLGALTCAEVRTMFPRCPRVTKAQLVDRVAARYPDSVIRARIAAHHRLIELVGRDVVLRLQILYFGGSADLSTFVLEDLGVVRFEPYAVDPAHRLFADRRTFERFLELTAVRDEIEMLNGAWEEHRARALVHRLARAEPSRLLERRRGQLLNRLGAVAERADETALALASYSVSGRPPGRERCVRILTRLGRSEEARIVLDEMGDAPRSGTEAQFAQAFAGRRMRRLPAPKETRLRLPQAPNHGVEDAALSALLTSGGRGRHLENQLPLTLFGLAFWDIVFAPVAGAFSHAYQDRPMDLYWSDFRTARADAIAARLASLRDADELRRRVCTTFAEKYGTANALVGWGAVDREFLELLVAAVPAITWCVLFDYLLGDIEHRRQGFPDLTIVYGRGCFEWIEVKGPGDQLRREQRLWFDFFARHGMPARVLRVEW